MKWLNKSLKLWIRNYRILAGLSERTFDGISEQMFSRILVEMFERTLNWISVGFFKNFFWPEKLLGKPLVQALEKILKNKLQSFWRNSLIHFLEDFQKVFLGKFVYTILNRKTVRVPEKKNAWISTSKDS